MDHHLVPFSQFVLKVHSRCDLACRHCYVYEHADSSWLGRPLGISDRTAERAAGRIAEHVRSHRLREVSVVLHGGEPLLLGVEQMARTLATLSSEIACEDTRLSLSIHTNGVLLSHAYLTLFDKFDVKVGVSLDGDRRANDRHRLYRDGRSSYDKVVAALNLLRTDRFRHLYAGLLCTVDIANDSVTVLQSLIAHDPPRIDFLLPHSTWDSQPPGLVAERTPANARHGGLEDGAGEYGRWLTRLYDAWDSYGRPIPVRFFDSILGSLRGEASQTEALGLAKVDLAVIEVDGTIEQADSLKTAFDGAPGTGFNVFDHDLDTAATHPGFAARQQGIDGLCAACRACPVVEVCGGGLYAHRYSAAQGFDNPSVYCADLFDTIMHIKQTSDSVSTAQQREPVTRHSLSGAQFAALASGLGDADAVRRLGEGEQSIRRGLVAQAGALAASVDGKIADAWQLIVALDEKVPDAVENILSHPYLRSWATACIEGVEHADMTEPARVSGHLAAIAASVALRAGAAVNLDLPVIDAAVRLPGLGALALPAHARSAVIQIYDDRTAEIRAGGVRCAIRLTAADVIESEEPRWQPLRRLPAAGFSVAIEDTDPYRGCHGHPTDRLSAGEVQSWAVEFQEAITFIDDHLPRYAPGLRAGLTTIMPMQHSSDGTHRSAAAVTAYGAIGAARPRDAGILALLLVHEFQHVKLGALLDLYALYDKSDTVPRHYAPWRPDPRPFEGLFQGTYAHLAVTDFWRVQRELLVGVAALAAEAHFARWRAHTAEAVEELLAAGSLTDLGERFVRAMGETVAPWLEERVSMAALTAAHRASREHRAAFERSRAAAP